jgi:hypothetical protein
VTAAKAASPPGDAAFASLVADGEAEEESFEFAKCADADTLTPTLTVPEEGGGAASAGGGSSTATCPADQPGDGDACEVLEINTTCSYDGTDCVCELGIGGLGWNCSGGTGGTCPGSQPTNADTCTVLQLSTNCTYGSSTCTCGIGIGGLT